MMAPGTVVRVLKGRGAGSLAAVLEDRGGRVRIADGRRLGIAAPKEKNRKHLEAIGGARIGPDGMRSDRALRRALREADPGGRPMTVKEREGTLACPNRM